MYFMTCLEKMNPDGEWTAEKFGDIRCWGYRADKDAAFESVINNVTDMCEGIYRYAVIERIPQGIGKESDERWFFEFDRVENKYVQIETPWWLVHAYGQLSFK